jgi:type IV secretory pathway TrbF-like protein
MKGWRVPTDTHISEGLEIVLGQLGKAITAGKYWRWFAGGCLLVVGLGVLVLAVLVLKMQPREVPKYIIVNSDTGEVRAIGSLPELITLPANAVAAKVEAFVEDLRSISDSQEATKAAWRRLYHQVTKEEGRPKLEKAEAEWQPTLQRKPVFVKILRTLAREPTRYDVVWQEARFNDKRILEETVTYSGQFVFKLQVPRTKEEQKDAPLGMFFYHWAWGPGA